MTDEKPSGMERIWVYYRYEYHPYKYNEYKLGKLYSPEKKMITIIIIEKREREKNQEKIRKQTNSLGHCVSVFIVHNFCMALAVVFCLVDKLVEAVAFPRSC